MTRIVSGNANLTSQHLQCSGNGWYRTQAVTKVQPETKKIKIIKERQANQKNITIKKTLYAEHMHARGMSVNSSQVISFFFVNRCDRVTNLIPASDCIFVFGQWHGISTMAKRTRSRCRISTSIYIRKRDAGMTYIQFPTLTTCFSRLELGGGFQLTTTHPAHSAAAAASSSVAR